MSKTNTATATTVNTSSTAIKAAKTAKRAPKKAPDAGATEKLEAMVKAQGEQIALLLAALEAKPEPVQPAAPAPQKVIVEVQSVPVQTVIRRDGSKVTQVRETQRESVIEAAPKELTDVNPLVISVKTEHRGGRPFLVLKTPEFSFKFHKSFCYHRVQKVGKVWETRKIQGEWVKLIPMEDRALLMEGLKEGFPGVTIQQS